LQQCQPRPQRNKSEFIRSGPNLTEARLGEVEIKYGIRLPADYRAFMLKPNGGEPEPRGVCRKRGKTLQMSCDCLFSIDYAKSLGQKPDSA
jgi:hypothetical protein